jgi:hypothetical protein
MEMLALDGFPNNVAWAFKVIFVQIISGSQFHAPAPGVIVRGHVYNNQRNFKTMLLEKGKRPMWIHSRKRVMGQYYIGPIIKGRNEIRFIVDCLG